MSPSSEELNKYNTYISPFHINCRIHCISWRWNNCAHQEALQVLYIPSKVRWNSHNDFDFFSLGTCRSLGGLCRLAKTPYFTQGNPALEQQALIVSWKNVKFSYLIDTKKCQPPLTIFFLSNCFLFPSMFSASASVLHSYFCLYSSHFVHSIVQFHKISIPTPWKVDGNSEGVGGLKSQNFKRKVWGLTGNSRGVGGGGVKLKSLPWEGYGYFLEQHIGRFCILNVFMGWDPVKVHNHTQSTVNFLWNKESPLFLRDITGNPEHARQPVPVSISHSLTQPLQPVWDRRPQ